MESERRNITQPTDWWAAWEEAAKAAEQDLSTWIGEQCNEALTKKVRAAWCELVATPQVATFGEYLTLIAAVQADQERQGREVVRAHFSVAEMLAALAERGLENTPDNRATITALKANVK